MSFSSSQSVSQSSSAGLTATDICHGSSASSSNRAQLSLSVRQASWIKLKDFLKTKSKGGKNHVHNVQSHQHEGENSWINLDWSGRVSSKQNKKDNKAARNSRISWPSQPEEKNEHLKQQPNVTVYSRIAAQRQKRSRINKRRKKNSNNCFVAIISINTESTSREQNAGSTDRHSNSARNSCSGDAATASEYNTRQTHGKGTLLSQHRRSSTSTASTSTKSLQRKSELFEQCLEEAKEMLDRIEI